MSARDQFKEEALRLLDHYPLDACERVATRLNGCGWKMTKFNVSVTVFGSMQWTAKVHIETDVCRSSHKQKWEELEKVFRELDLDARQWKFATTTSHRKYDRSDVTGRRYVIGHWHEFHVEFKPAKPLELSVLTEEEDV